MLHEAQTSAGDRTEHREGGRRGDPGRLRMDRETDEGGGPICTPSAVRLHSKSPPPRGPRVHPGKSPRRGQVCRSRPRASRSRQRPADGGTRRGARPGHGARGASARWGQSSRPGRGQSPGVELGAAAEGCARAKCPRRRRVPRHDARGVRSCASRRNFFVFKMISDFVLSFKTLVQDPSMTAPGGTVRAPDWGRLHRSRWR